MNLQEKVKPYLEYCTYRKELDTKTIKAYRIDLTQFFSYVQSAEPEKETIEQYITDLHKKYKQKTIKRKIASIKAFYSYLEEEELVEQNPFRKIKVKFKETIILPRIIPREEIEQLLNYIYASIKVTANYYCMKGNKVIIAKQVLLDDVVWMYCKANELGCHIGEQLKTELIETYYQLYKEIYENNIREEVCPSVHEYYQGWKLRGDNPEIYKLNEVQFKSVIVRTELLKFDRYQLNPRVSNEVRRNRKYRRLYELYHYNEAVRKEGDKITEFKIHKEYINLVRQIQEQMMQELACKGIGIETNPSSNYLIGTIKKYEEHPILRFNSRKLKQTNGKNHLSVSINTDDQGVFDTLLENEYGLMALALKKATDEDLNTLYDIEDIYEWIDYVRSMGVNQVF